ncbi:tyrosine-type recombinase/integrase [Methylobacterium oryzae]|uniref:Integrase family protein n=1 Tax=Methylobacterium oryzae CBMB20 TaxID=693986 RepID=A0A089NTR1_9HYPH|nr:integrase arm-type DNA-binding domain-containing protein [Methylobacterium oryzae]AIQ91326.1 Integrase family protein [Methylobacterium oryzae CBMB20]
MPRFKFTTTSLSRHLTAPQSGAQTVVWDTETRGLGAYCGKTGVASFFVHCRVAGRQRKTTLGRVNEIAIADARAKAAEIMLAASQGRDVEEERAATARSRLSLADAFAEYTSALQRKEASPRTLSLNEHNWRKMLAPYGTRDLRTLTRREVRAWHESWGQIGPTAANQGARLLRAIYNYADRKLADDLPTSPCVAVEFFKERGTRRVLSWDELPGWWDKVVTLGNPVRRVYWKLLLLSGLRMSDAATIRWEDVRGNVLRRPNPKGGRGRAFDLPLTLQLRTVFAEAREAAERLHQGSPWVFPAESACGHVTNMRELKAFPGVWPHDLRRTYATACAEAGIDPYTIKLLLNHALDRSDVTSLYVRPSAGHVAAAAQKVADFLETKVQGTSSPRSVVSLGAFDMHEASAA